MSAVPSTGGRPASPVIPGAPAAAREPSRAGEIQPVHHEGLHRTITGLVTGVPVLALGVAMWQAWDGLLHASDLAVFAIVYVLTGLGVTVGFHRLLTHRSFKAGAFVRGVLAILGSAAIEGPAISWVADHRKHHAYSDRPGDPHSPHVDHGVGWAGAVRGLFHAHVGWLFRHDQRGGRERYAPDLLADPHDPLRRSHLRAVGGRRPRRPVRARRGHRRVDQRRAHRAAVGRGREAARPASRHVQHQLDLPRVRPARLPDRPTSRATSPGSRWPRSASRGTTTTMPSRPRRSTASAAGSSISPRSSSAASRPPGSRGTSCASARSAAPRPPCPATRTAHDVPRGGAAGASGGPPPVRRGSSSPARRRSSPG